MRELAMDVLQAVSGGDNDEVTVRGHYQGEINPHITPDALAEMGLTIDEYLNQFNVDSDLLLVSGDGGADSETESAAEKAAKAAATGLEAALEQGKKEGLDYVKIGDKIFKIDDVLSALKSGSMVFDGVSLVSDIYNGDLEGVLETIGDAVIAAGVGAAVSALTGNPAIGVLAGAAAAEAIDSGQLIMAFGSVLYDGGTYAYDEFVALTNTLPGTSEQSIIEQLTGQNYDWLFDPHHEGSGQRE